jgi:hypothetical protein
VTTIGKDKGLASHPAFIMLQSQALDNIEAPQHQADSLFYINNPVGEFMAVHRGLNLWNHWILDSGASGHLIGRKDVFVDGTYTSIAGVESNGIRGAKVVLIGRGTIRIECKTSQGKRLLEIPGVQYSPNAGVNLISLTEIWPYGILTEELLQASVTSGGQSLIDGYCEASAERNRAAAGFDSNVFNGLLIKFFVEEQIALVVSVFCQPEVL